MSMKFKDTIDGSIAKNSATATKLATARTITIGSKGKTFDGSDNVSWSLSEIGAAASSHNHDDRYYTESEINTKVSALQSEIDADVKAEADRAKAAENTLQANIDKKANSSHGNHVPTTQTANNAKFLRNDNTWQTVTPGNIGAYTKTEIDSKVTTINNTISGKANKSHGNHVPETETANNAKFLRNDNTWQTVTPDNIGAATSSHGTHVTYSKTTPKAAGTAAVGSEGTVARGDHVHPLQTSVSGNAGTATKLQTARSINGTSFDGSGNITTANWGSSRNISISDSDGTNTGKAVSVNGSANTTLKLPATIKASLSGNAATATSAGKWTTARTLTIGNKGQSVNGSGNVSWSLADIGAVETVAWDASIKCATWSRLFQYSATNAVIGGAFLVNIQATRGNVVYGPTILVNFGHSTTCNIVQINNISYSDIKIRGVVDVNGLGYLEIYDNANGATNSTTQGVTVSVTKLTKGLSITKYTAFTNGTTIPTGYASKGEITTVSGCYYTGKAATSGNADTAAKAGKWSTARTLTIGNKGKSVDGSGNVSWSLSEIGAAASGHNHDSTYSKTGHTHNYAGASSAGGVATSAAKLAAAKTITIGNAGKSFDGSANISYTLSEIGAAASGHTHNQINSRGKVTCESGVTGRPAVAGLSMSETYSNGYPTEYGNVINLRGQGDGQILVGWSGSDGAHAPVYVRSKRDNVATANWSDWAQFYTTANKPTYSDVGAAKADHGTHVTYATATPKANGTAAIGTSGKVAREDHVHPLQTSVSGNAGTATKLATARTLTIGNKGKSFNGSADVSWTLSEIGASPLQKSVVSKSVSNGKLTLSTDRYQKASLASGNTIVLPSVSNFTEINLFVKGALTNINLPDNCKWRVDHNLSAGTSYMFTFIYTTVEWLAEVKIYS